MGRIAMRYQLGKPEHRSERRTALLRLARYHRALRIRQLEVMGRDIAAWSKPDATGYPVGSMQRVCATANAYAAAFLEWQTRKQAGETADAEAEEVRTAGRHYLHACDTLQEGNVPKRPKRGKKKGKATAVTTEAVSSS